MDEIQTDFTADDVQIKGSQVTIVQAVDVSDLIDQQKAVIENTQEAISQLQTQMDMYTQDIVDAQAIIDKVTPILPKQ